MSSVHFENSPPLPCFWETLRPGKRNWQPRRPPRHPEWRPETGCAVGRKTGNHQRTESTEQGTLWLDLCGSKAYNTCLLLFLSTDFRFRCQKHHCIALHFVLTVINTYLRQGGIYFLNLKLEHTFFWVQSCKPTNISPFYWLSYGWVLNFDVFISVLICNFMTFITNLSLFNSNLYKRINSKIPPINYIKDTFSPHCYWE